MIKQITPAPHVRTWRRSYLVMIIVFLALMPSAIWSVMLYGEGALTNFRGFIGFTILFELIMNLFYRKLTITDGSALVTGMILSLSFPPGLSLVMMMQVSFFSIIAIKWALGGLGFNYLNPAMMGRAFGMAAWPSQTIHYPLPQFQGLVANNLAVDTVTSATPGSLLTRAVSGGESLLSQISQLYGSASDSLGWLDLFLGTTNGSLGEISALMAIIGFFILTFTKILSWQVTLYYILGYAIASYFMGYHPFSLEYVLLEILTGSVLFIAIFMATDMASLPSTRFGKIVYGFLMGLISLLTLRFAPGWEGMTLGVIILNLLSPIINKLTLGATFSGKIMGGFR